MRLRDELVANCDQFMGAASRLGSNAAVRVLIWTMTRVGHRAAGPWLQQRIAFNPETSMLPPVRRRWWKRLRILGTILLLAGLLAYLNIRGIVVWFANRGNPPLILDLRTRIASLGSIGTFRGRDQTARDERRSNPRRLCLGRVFVAEPA